jgi:hypothetical protein
MERDRDDNTVTTKNTAAMGVVVEGQVRACVYLAQQKQTQSEIAEWENKTRMIQGRIEVNNILKPFITHEK